MIDNKKRIIEKMNLNMKFLRYNLLIENIKRKELQVHYRFADLELVEVK